LVLAAIGLLCETLCTVGSIGTLLWLCQQVFSADATARSLMLDKLSDPRVIAWVGDWTGLVAWVPSGRFAGFAFLLGIVAVFAVAGGVGRFAHHYCTQLALTRLIALVREDMFDRLVRLDMETVIAEGSADRLSRVMRDTGGVRAGLAEISTRAIRQVLQGVALLGWAILLDWRLVAIFVLPLPLVLYMVRQIGRRVRASSHQTLTLWSPTIAAFQRVLKGLRVVKVHHAEDSEATHFKRTNRRLLDEQLRLAFYKSLSSPAMELMAILILLLLMLGAAWYVFEAGGQQPAQMVLVIGLLGMAAATLRPLTEFNNALQSSDAAAERVLEVLHLPIEDFDVDAKQPGLPRHAESVVFDSVGFTYPGREDPALLDIELKVPHGALCAIVGPNGAGKTTLLGLLPRLYPPSCGRVLIDGHDIASHSLRSLRRQMAVITQETVLFDGTVAENIAYGLSDVLFERVVDAASRAHAHEFIEKLPQGYDTEVGEDGVRLSGGQRQRIAIARAILRDPAILIFDEATSEIDSESESRIIEALDEVTRDCTTFVIAHRLSTVAHADMIIVLRDGQVDAVGTHEHLMETCELYQNLSRMQLSAGEGSGANRRTTASRGNRHD